MRMNTISALTMTPATATPSAAAQAPVPQDAVVGTTPTSSEVSQAAIRELFRSQGPSEGHVLWRAKVDEGTKAPAAVGSDGALYVVTDRGVTSLNKDGSQRWKTALKGLQGCASPVFTPDGNILVTGGYKCPGLNALGPGGNILWQRPLGTAQVPPVFAPDGSIYFGDYDGIVYHLDASGNETWRHDVGSHVNGEIGVGQDGTVYAIGDPGLLHAIDKDGKPRWTKFKDRAMGDSVQTGAGVRVTPEGELLMVNWNSHLRCMGPNGKTRWQYGAFTEKRLDEIPRKDRRDAVQAGNTGMGSTPVLSPDGKTIYVGGMDGRLHAVDREGHKQWVAEVGDDMGDHSVQVAADGTIYTVSEHEGSVHAVSPEGQILWAYKADKPQNYAYIATSGDEVYLTMHNGDVFALSSKALQQRVEEASRNPDAPPPKLVVGEGHIIINGIKVPKRQ